MRPCITSAAGGGRADEAGAVPGRAAANPRRVRAGRRPNGAGGRRRRYDHGRVAAGPGGRSDDRRRRDDAVIARQGREAGIPESEIERSRRIHDISDGAFRLALAAGLPIGFASDSSVIPHGENAWEFVERAHLGEEPMAGIVAATSLNAEIMGWSERVGAVEAGKFADLIAVAGNPLEDIRLLTRVGFVMKAGVVYKDEIQSQQAR